MKSIRRYIGKAAFILGMIALWLVNWPAGAQAQEVPEYQLKAAFLYNFAKFTEWPQSAFKDRDAPLVIGILGKDPFGANIDFLNNKIVKNRKLAVQRFNQVDELETCHILFVCASEKKRLAEILEAVNDSTLLTVGDMDAFIESGGIIRFMIENENLGFAVNAEALRHAAFKISTQLLKFGQLVAVDPQSPGKP